MFDRLKSICKQLLSHSASRYLITGSCAFGIDYLSLMFFYYALSLSLVVATSIGFISGMVVSFVLNRLWVFRSSGKDRYVGRQLIEYCLLVAFNYFFTVFFVRYLNQHSIKPYIGKLLTMVLVMSWNYALFRWVIFRGSKELPVE